MGSGVALNILALALYLNFLTVGTTLIALGARGRLVVSPPRCARCGQRIARGEFERSGRCPECGNDIAERGGIRYMRRQRRTGLSYWLWSRLAVHPRSARARTLGQHGLIERAQRANITTRRVTSLKAAFLANLCPETAPTPQRLTGALALAAIVFERGAGDTDLGRRVIDACFTPQTLWSPILATPHPALQLDPTIAPHRDHALTLKAIVRSLKVDDVSRDIVGAQSGDGQRAAVLPLALKPFEPGPHRVQIEVELLLYSRFDASRILGPDYSPLAESDWPAPLAQKMMTLGSAFETPAR